MPEAAFPSLKRLKTLNLSKNPKLKKLPKTIGHCHAIQNLVGPDPDVVQYPPQNIVNQGTEQIMKFLAKGKTKPLFSTLDCVQYISGDSDTSTQYCVLDRDTCIQNAVLDRDISTHSGVLDTDTRTQYCDLDRENTKWGSGWLSCHQ